MSWRLARSLETLRSQVNAAYPRRSKVSDGTIGDAAHARTASDHNPNRNGVVCALDLTDDPRNGFDAHALAEHLRRNRHPNLRYVISRARIAGWWTNWEWRPSAGHFNHVHISVGTHGVGDGQTYDNYDSTAKWSIIQSKEEVKVIGNKNHVNAMFRQFKGRNATASEQTTWSKRTWSELIDKIDKSKVSLITTLAQLKRSQDALKQSSAALNAAKSEIAASSDLRKQLDLAQGRADEAIARAAALERQLADRDEAVNSIWQSIGDLINNLIGRKS